MPAKRSIEDYEQEIKELREQRRQLKLRMELLTHKARAELRILTKKINGLETSLAYKLTKKENECVGKD